MIKKLIVMVCSVLCFFILSGCSADKSDKFIGIWKDSNRSSTILEIEKNGNNFIITQYRLSQTCSSGKESTPESCYKLKSNKSTASLQKDGILKVNDFIPATLAYVEKDNTLLVSKGAHLIGGNYTKSDDLKKEQYITTLLNK